MINLKHNSILRAPEYPHNIQQIIKNKWYIDRFWAASDIYSNPKSEWWYDIIQMFRYTFQLELHLSWHVRTFSASLWKACLWVIVMCNFFYFNQFCRSPGFMYCHLTMHPVWRDRTSASWLCHALPCSHHGRQFGWGTTSMPAHGIIPACCHGSELLV